jgi:hypothetical protein
MQAIDRIVFHIGAYKTGTTAIQQSLVDAHETLLTRGCCTWRRAGAVPGSPSSPRTSPSVRAP